MTDDVERTDGGLDAADASLLALIDRLGSLLDRSDLSELAVEAGGTRLVLRKPSAIASVAAIGPAAPAAATDGPPAPGAAGAGAAGAAELPSRPRGEAPLKGVWCRPAGTGPAAVGAAGGRRGVGACGGPIEGM